MELKKCSVDGRVYCLEDQAVCSRILNSSHREQRLQEKGKGESGEGQEGEEREEDGMLRVLRLVSLCHTVLVTRQEGG